MAKVSLSNLKRLSKDEQNLLKSKTEKGYDNLSDIIDSIIAPYCSDLDDCVEEIREALYDSDGISDDQLESFCMSLSTNIYYAGTYSEYIGVKDDIASALYNEAYHKSRADIEGGTVADKNSLAELSTQKEMLVSLCYTRSYRIMKAKVDNAQELLASCKKILSRRMQEMELTKIGR